MYSVSQEYMEAATRLAAITHPVTEEQRTDIVTVLREAQKYPTKFLAQLEMFHNTVSPKRP